MKRTLLALTLALFAGVLPATSFAQAREANEQARVTAGSADGSLTRREARRLRRQERRIDRMERRTARDGVVTPREHVRLARARARHSRHIYRARHNLRTR